MQRLPLTRWAYGIAGLLPMVYLTLATGFAWLGFGPEPFFVIPLAIIALVSFWWPNRWLMLVGALVAALLVAGGTQGDPGYLRPDRQTEFGYWWLTIAVGIIMVATAVLHFVATRRDVPGARHGGIAVGVVALALGLYLGGVAASAQEHAFVPAAEGAAIGIHADKEMTLTAKADKWEPASLAIPAGKVVKLTITNADAGAHVFNQAEAGLAVDLPAGATKIVWLRLDTAGNAQYYCEIHSAKGADGKYAGMVGEITVA